MGAVGRAFALAVLGAAYATGMQPSSAGEAEHGALLFRACAACHSLEPDRNMTGPSLAGFWGRRAGSLASFERYSPALKSSGLVWDEKTLDAWLQSPSGLVPDTRMAFPGIPDARQRSDLIAFLKAASAGKAEQPPAARAARFPDLKEVGADHRVEAIRYCRDTYHVTTADGKTADFWEANLRIKTDSSATGPAAGKPAILPAGMMGDRASVFFASPEEIAKFIKRQC